MEEHLVLYPSPGIGHLVPMVELAKRFFLLNSNYSRYHLTVILSVPPFNAGSTAPYIRRISASYPSITFHRLPPVSLPLERSPSRHHEASIFRLAHLNNPLLSHALSSISAGSPVRALILDFFCHPALDVAAELGIAPYLFFTSPASFLSVFLHAPSVHHRLTASYGDMPRDTRLQFPGMPPFAPQDMPLSYMDRHDEAYEGFIASATRLANSAQGMLVNTFDLLEPRALKALSESLFTLDRPTPPIYAIGPLIASDHEGAEEGHYCLKWLDLQPPKSVVFLSFGSKGLFSAKQLKEIAIGLERSGQRFLWVVRSPPADHKNGTHIPLLATPEPDLEELMPKGFLERTGERGMVVKSWAPQVAVLSREAVGGFITHCGWNSILEAIWAGMPMVAWPLYAEQRLNRVMMVKETRLAIPIEEDEKGFVTAEEVERRVRELMESEEGKRLRDSTAEMRMAAISAWGQGGSSHRALSELVQSVFEREY